MIWAACSAALGDVDKDCTSFVSKASPRPDSVSACWPVMPGPKTARAADLPQKLIACRASAGLWNTAKEPPRLFSIMPFFANISYFEL